MADYNEPVNAPEVAGSKTQELIEAFKSGQADLAPKESSPSDSPVDNNTEVSDQSQEESKDYTDVRSFMDALDKGAEDSEESESEQELSQNDSEEQVDAKSSDSEDIEEVTVTGPKGRRKLKLDFSDRDKIKKHVQMSYGARKWQKERDDARSELESVREEFSSLKSDWDKIEQAYQSKGYKGLIDLLEGKQDAWQEVLAQARQEEEQFANMSEEEKAVLERDRKLQEASRREQELQEKYEKQLREIQERQEQAEMRNAESKIVPAFDRYRFRGTLGDSVAETEFDEMLWNRALTRLEDIPDDVELTQAMVDKEFRRVASAMKKHMQTQVESKVNKAINRTKQSAAKKAQAKVTKSMRNSAEVEEFRQNIKSGNLVDGLTSFFKAGGRIK